MDRNPKPNYMNFRPLVLTSLLALLSILAAMDIAYLTHIVGHILLMISLGVLAVIFMTCDRSIFKWRVFGDYNSILYLIISFG